jgi:hypothetical protein
VVLPNREDSAKILADNARFRGVLSGIALATVRQTAIVRTSRFDGALEALVPLNPHLVLSRLACLARGHHFGLFRFGPKFVSAPSGILMRESIVSKKLYAGNLSYNVTSADLEQMFAEFGEVRSAEVIQDRDTGRSKGFGFVEMADDNAANQAIQALNLKEHDGRAMSVNEAKPREARSGGGGGGRGGYRGGSRYGR